MIDQPASPAPSPPSPRPVAPGIARILTGADLDRAELLHGFVTRALLDGRLRVLPHRTTWIDARAARVASAVWRLCAVRCEEAGLGFAGVGPGEAPRWACPVCRYDMGHPGSSTEGECQGCHARLRVGPDSLELAP